MTSTETNPAMQLSSKFHEALDYANSHHKDKARKSTTIPYMCHPLGVASLVIEAGGTEIEAIAALLHDVAEDHGGEPRLAEIKELFGDDVERIVRACSDSITEDPDVKDDWKERKLAHIAKLKNATQDVLIVTAADKAHNARSIVTDLHIEGSKVWGRFSVKSPKSIIWYYESMYKILKKKDVSPVLLFPLKDAIKYMKKQSL